MIGENCRARATVVNSIAELITIDMIKEVTIRKGKVSSERDRIRHSFERKIRRIAISRL